MTALVYIHVVFYMSIVLTYQKLVEIGLPKNEKRRLEVLALSSVKRIEPARLHYVNYIDACMLTGYNDVGP